MVVESTDPRTAVLLLEAARIADRLDQIDAIITGKADWIELMHFRTKNDDAQEVTVTLDDVLAEARQQATTLRGILAQLDVPKAEVAAPKVRSGLDELRARRAARTAEGVADSAGAAPA
jgi:hypothetical protein